MVLRAWGTGPRERVRRGVFGRGVYACMYALWRVCTRRLCEIRLTKAYTYATIGRRMYVAAAFMRRRITGFKRYHEVSQTTPQPQLVACVVEACTRICMRCGVYVCGVYVFGIYVCQVRCTPVEIKTERGCTPRAYLGWSP